MKIDLHVHTSHSYDCKCRVEEVIRTAEENGLDAVAITDHDTLSGIEIARGLSRSVTVIPGIELSTWKGIHLVGLFVTDEIISRDILEIVDEIHDQGGLAVLPHPFRHSTGLIYGKEKHQLFSGDDLREIISRIDLVEVINQRCTPEENLEACNYFDAYLDIPQTAGSDAHEAVDIGRAFIELDIDNTDDPDKIKKGLLKANRTIRYEAFAADGKKADKKKPVVSGKGIIANLKGTFSKIIKRNRDRGDSDE